MPGSLHQSADRAVQCWRALLAFFPTEPIAVDAIIQSLEQMCETPEQVEWLTGAAVNSWTKWESIAALRTLCASRFRPKDGIVPGQEFDPEREYQERQAKETAAKIGQWKEERKLLSRAERDDINREVGELNAGIEAAVKRLPGPRPN